MKLSPLADSNLSRAKPYFLEHNPKPPTTSPNPVSPFHHLLSQRSPVSMVCVLSVCKEQEPNLFNYRCVPGGLAGGHCRYMEHLNSYDWNFA